MSNWPRFRTAGDRCLVVELDNQISRAVSRRVRILSEKIRPLPGVTALVPTYRSVVVHYDPLEISHRDLVREIISRVSSRRPAGGSTHRTVEIPTCYGGELGPDLDFVARHHGLTAEQVISLHSGKLYHVYMLGFLPGFPYLGELHRRLITPRLKNPRSVVPAGSVGIGGSQTGIYPVDSPGGWRIIGRTPLKLYDPGKNPPVLLKAGDCVRFVEISEAEYRRLSGLPAGCAVPLFKVIQPGLLTTVQDLGRHGYQQFGIPPSGAADHYSFKLANLLVGNDENRACLEITAIGPRLEVLGDTVIAVTGADLGARLDEKPLPGWRSVPVKAGSVISFFGPGEGCRAYLAVAGGIEVPPVMESRSTFLRTGLGGYRGRALEAGDVLAAAGAGREVAGCGAQPREVPPNMLPSREKPRLLRVVPGPRDDYFSRKGMETFFSSEYSVSIDSDRTGLRLEGPNVEHLGPAEIISDGTVPGTVQVPGHGKPIILFVDSQTAGGYPEIGTIVSIDLPKVAQLMPGDAVRFVPVTVEQAQSLLLDEDRKIKRWIAALE